MDAGSKVSLRRRTVLRLSLAPVLWLAGLSRSALATVSEPIRIGLTPVFLDDQVGFLHDWRAFLEARLERTVEFVQRGSYREVVDLVRQSKIQFAWLCGYPYVRNRSRLRLLAVPVHRGQPLYQSYLIVPAKDTQTRLVFDLKDRVFAYSDPDSNSGFLYPQYQLVAANARPATFFRRSFFTYSHRNVVEAVAAGVAHGGAVDGYVWETLKLLHPESTARTRVADRSPHFGFPPLVSAASVPPGEARALASVLLSMHLQPEGRRLLKRLDLDRFDAGSPQLYDSIERMVRVVGGGEH